MFANKKDAKAAVKQTQKSNITPVPKQIYETLKTELLTTERKLRNDARTMN